MIVYEIIAKHVKWSSPLEVAKKVRAQSIEGDDSVFGSLGTKTAIYIKILSY